MAVQTRRVLDNLAAVLAAGGSDLGRMLKMTVYLTDLADFAEVNRVFAEVFPQAPPARAVVQVSALPKGARLEIDGWAMVRVRPRSARQGRGKRRR
jgi:2-iminobutanoate/2-iminopropanoate deaminase